jgi:hypothetical protein
MINSLTSLIKKFNILNKLANKYRYKRYLKRSLGNLHQDFDSINEGPIIQKIRKKGLYVVENFFSEENCKSSTKDSQLLHAGNFLMVYNSIHQNNTLFYFDNSRFVLRSISFFTFFVLIILIIVFNLKKQV